jgi:hypothetical protein
VTLPTGRRSCRCGAKWIALDEVQSHAIVDMVLGCLPGDHANARAFWKLTKWGIACGLGLPTMAIMSLWLFSIDYRNQVQTIFAYATAAIAAILFIAITLNLAQVFFLK